MTVLKFINIYSLLRSF